jgi:predicted Fe-S protein YdhL (DUF1289 family)
MLDETLGRCLGCGRTREEIARWSWSSDEERLAIVQRAKARRDDPPADG